MPGRSPDCYDTIILIGFSFGGDAVHDLAHLLKAEGISVNLVVTLDPVPRLPKIKDKDAGYSKSDNVDGGSIFSRGTPRCIQLLVLRDGA